MGDTARETPCFQGCHPYFATGLQRDRVNHSSCFSTGLRWVVVSLVVLMILAVGILAAHPGWHAALHGHMEVSVSQEQHPDDEGAGDSDGCVVCGWIQQQIVTGSPSVPMEGVLVLVKVVPVECGVGPGARVVEAPGDPRGPPDRA